MENIESVNAEIQKSESGLQEARKKIKDTEGRLRDAKAGAEKVKADMQSLKERRQSALAAGQDASTLNASMKKLADDVELREDEQTGLERLLAELKSIEANLSTKPGGLRLRVLQLESVELAKKYNQVSGELANIVRGLNEVHFKIDSSGYNGKQHRVVFAPSDYFENVPRLFFDAEGLNLEGYVAKNPGKYHSNIMCPACEKNFYLWSEHRTNLINGK